MIELLVNFEEFWTRLKEDIAAAEHSVSVQTFAFEGDTIGKNLSSALLQSKARQKRILADSFTRIVLNDRFKYSPANLLDHDLRSEARETLAMIRRLRNAAVEIRFTNPYGLSPRKLLSRNHKKLIILDSKVAYLGGINFSEHNANWHDMMLRIEDERAAAFLLSDFDSTWLGRDLNERYSFKAIEFLTADGRHNRSVFQRVLDLIDGARQSIFVESPYITFPFYERLRAAARRGVAVKIVTPQQNNWVHFANYAQLEAARSEIDLRLYQDGMSHLKAMLIDDQYLVAGSSNFDYLSYRVYQEIVGIFTEPHLIADFRERVMLRDLSNSKAAECRASALSKRWLELQTRVVDAAVTILTA